MTCSRRSRRTRWLSAYPFSRSRTNGVQGRSSSRSPLSQVLTRATTRFCSRARSSRSAAAWATTPRSWRVPRSRISSPPGGTSTNHSAPSTAAPTTALRRAKASGSATRNGGGLSHAARHWLGGLLEHAVAGSVFTTPTVTGFKRYRPDSFAPDRVAWAYENRGALLRVIGEAGSSATHIENRVGDPAANPYLYLASQVAAGTDGLRRRLDPGPPGGD